jgi:hypothetical protein
MGLAAAGEQTESHRLGSIFTPPSSQQGRFKDVSDLLVAHRCVPVPTGP